MALKRFPTCVAPLGSMQMNFVRSRILRIDDAFAGLTLQNYIHVWIQSESGEFMADIRGRNEMHRVWVISGAPHCAAVCHLRRLPARLALCSPVAATERCRTATVLAGERKLTGATLL